MQTYFAPDQLKNAKNREAEKILRTCVHCGICTATCPTYILDSNELDSPRGRIYLIKEMLENNQPATEKVVKHIDRCLSCLSCMTACPGGVNYMHLIDHARAYIEATYKRPLMDRVLRQTLAMVLPYPKVFRVAMQAGALARPFSGVAKTLPGGDRLGAMLDLIPKRLPKKEPLKPIFMNLPQRKRRVALLGGCAQPVLNPGINAATLRFLERHKVEVVIPKKEGCCGALVHHLGKESASHEFAKRNIDLWIREADRDRLDAIIITASGCGTTVKDYGYMFKDDPEYAEKAARVSALAKDITEFVDTLKFEPTITLTQTVAYHSACSMQHGQQITDTPKLLLEQAGFKVKNVPEGHICCGSAGTYNIMQPKIAGQLRDRKIKNIERTKPDIIATGNIGCMTQLALATDIPLVHTIELLDWATGGPKPSALPA